MDKPNQGRYAFLLVFISFVFVIGSLVTAYAETSDAPQQAPAGTTAPKVTDIVLPSPTSSLPTLPPVSTATESPIPSDTSEPGPTDTQPPPSHSQCAPPADWIIYFIQPGDSLESIAEAHQTTASVLTDGNCLDTTELLPGYIIFVPPLSPTATTISSSGCTTPPGWITYTVKSGDNLYQISLLFQTTVAELQAGNCMGSSTTIITGTRLWVPNNATITPTRTKTAASPSKTPTPDTPAPPPNKAPVAVNDGPYSVALGDTLTISSPGVLTNDSDPDSDPLTASLVLGPVCATSFTLNPDGSFEYVADVTCAAASDIFKYVANDGTDDSNVAVVMIIFP